MQVIWKGLHIDLPDEDPRAAAIEGLLFGRVVAAAAPDSTQPQVPEGWREFWAGLTPRAQAWLGRLVAGSVLVSLARAVTGGSLVGLHRHLAARAKLSRMPLPVVSIGRAAHRRISLRPEAVGPVAALAAQARP